MPIVASSFTALSDADLLVEVSRLATCERHATVQLIASLAELDARRLYLGRGFSSMFTYCTDALHLSEHAAYNRIEAARTARRFPTILDRLADGSITLTTVCLLNRASDARQPPRGARRRAAQEQTRGRSAGRLTAAAAAGAIIRAEASASARRASAGRKTRPALNSSIFRFAQSRAMPALTIDQRPTHAQSTGTAHGGAVDAH